MREGSIIKSYKDMCKLIGEKVKAGNGKKYQLEEWSRFFKWHKSGNSFVIEKIYPTPKRKNDNRGKASIFSDIIQVLIMDYLLESNDLTVVATRNKLLKHMKMINSNYIYCSRNIPELSLHVNVNEQIVHDFYNTTTSNFKSTFETALKNLRNKALIMYENVISICDEYNNHRMATEEEKKIVLCCEREVLDEMGYKDISTIRISSNWNEFKHNLIELLTKKTHIKYYYSSYKITVNEEYLSREYDNLMMMVLNELQREEYKNELNATAIERLLINAKNRKSKAYMSDNKMSNVRRRDSYVNDHKLLIGMLIDSEAGSIVRDIENYKKKHEEFSHMINELDEIFM